MAVLTKDNIILKIGNWGGGGGGGGEGGDNRTTFCKEMYLDWTENFECLVIRYEINKIKENADIIIEKEISEIIKSITIWSARHLTPLGKIIIIKIYLFKKSRMFCCPFPLPKNQYLKKLIYTTPLHDFIAIWHSLLERNGQIKVTS